MSHYLYLLACDDPAQPHVKIGSTGDLKQRMRVLQTGCSAQLFILFAFNLPGPDVVRRVERSLHRRLEFVRFKGEWYAAPWHDLLRACAAHVADFLRSKAFLEEGEIDQAIEQAGVYEALALADDIEEPAHGSETLFIVKALQFEA